MVRLDRSGDQAEGQGGAARGVRRLEEGRVGDMEEIEGYEGLQREGEGI